MSKNPHFNPPRGRVYDSIVDTIGATPLVRINRLAKESGARAELLAKRNPTHNTGFFEEKWVAPDFTQFDIAQKGWSGAAPPTRDLREASEETEEPAHM